LRARENLIITRAAELTALPAFRTFISGTCRNFGIPEQIAFDLELACDEAATNVITHGYAGMNPGSLMLELHFSPRRVTLILSDFGHPFEPLEPTAPDVDAILHDQPTSGFGLYFIYSTMDDVNYYTDEQGNHLVLTRNLSSEHG
jgi:anti-sigma regulatory factor (Ser/Thr protein kinase)